VPVSFTRSNAGVSAIFRRITSPTATSTMLSRKGTRQPQERNCSSGYDETAVKSPVAINSPADDPIWGQLP
jgi:hypothetical protein